MAFPRRKTCSSGSNWGGNADEVPGSKTCPSGSNRGGMEDESVRIVPVRSTWGSRQISTWSSALVDDPNDVMRSQREDGEK
jgi:hypothetical protein